MQLVLICCCVIFLYANNWQQLEELPKSIITTYNPYIINIRRLPDDSLSLGEHKLLKVYLMPLEVFRNMNHINVDPQPKV